MRNPDESPDELVELAAHIREDKVRRMIMSTAEQLIEKGIKKGRLVDARKLLEAGQSVDFVISITELTLADLQEAGLL